MARDSAPSADDALALLQFAHRAIAQEPDAALGKRSLTRMHHRILFTCRRNEGLSITQLLGLLQITKQAAHAPLRELIDGGLVESKPDREDRRARRLKLTSQGRAIELKLSEPQREAFVRAFEAEGKRSARAWGRVMRAVAGGGDDRSGKPQEAAGSKGKGK